MIVYCYDANGYFVMDKQIIEGGVMPDNSTKIKPPPVGEHTVSVFLNGEWRIKSDYTGVNACQIGEDGSYLGEYLFVIGEIPSDRIIITAPPIKDMFYKAKWNGSNWVEGSSKEEIDALKALIPKTPTEMTHKLAEQEAQISYMRQQLVDTNSIMMDFMDFLFSTLQELQ